MKKINLKKGLSYFILSIGGAIIGILLIPVGIIIFVVNLIWKLTDKAIRSFGRE
jgi:hypothetical protein